MEDGEWHKFTEIASRIRYFVPPHQVYRKGLLVKKRYLIRGIGKQKTWDMETVMALGSSRLSTENLYYLFASKEIEYRGDEKNREYRMTKRLGES